MSAYAPSSLALLCAACLGLSACAGGARAPATTAKAPAVAQSAPTRVSPADARPEVAAARDIQVADAQAASAPATPPGPFTMAAAGLRAAPPAGWRTRRKATALVYEGPMRLPSVALFEPQKARSFQGAVDGLAAELATPLGAVRVTKQPTETTVAGYRAYVAEGTGRAEGFPMRWRATVVDAARPTIILGLAPTFFWGGNAGKIRNFERSIQRAPVETAMLGRRSSSVR